jgi:hypothetical protein
VEGSGNYDEGTEWRGPGQLLSLSQMGLRTWNLSSLYQKLALVCLRYNGSRRLFRWFWRIHLPACYQSLFNGV